MAKEQGQGLKKRILEEMTVDHASALEKHFELAKHVIRITKEGKVDLPYKDKFTGKEQILLYLIGKLYAREAGLVNAEDVGNKELMDELGIPRGSILPGIKDLKDSGKIKEVKKGKYTHHIISINMIEKTLKSALQKIKKDN